MFQPRNVYLIKFDARVYQQIHMVLSSLFIMECDARVHRFNTK